MVPVITPEALGRTLSTAADPELARLALSRVGEDPGVREVLAREDVLAVAVRVLGFSTAAADFLVAHPEEISVFADVRARTRAELDAELADDVQRLGAVGGLRRFRNHRIRVLLYAGRPNWALLATMTPC